MPSYIRPHALLEKAEIKELRRKALDALLAAVQADGNDPAGFIVRDILPHTDLGIGTVDEWVHTFSSANTEENFVDSKELGDKQYVVFYGVGIFSASPKTIVVRFKVGSAGAAGVKAVYNIEQLYVYPEIIGYFKEPIVYKASDVVTITLEGRETGTEEIVLFGFWAEPSGKTLSK